MDREARQAAKRVWLRRVLGNLQARPDSEAISFAKLIEVQYRFPFSGYLNFLINQSWANAARMQFNYDKNTLPETSKDWVSHHQSFEIYLAVM